MMELHFLGTASCFPSPDRGVSCIALQKDGAVWLFDCGEGSQIQLQKSKVKPGRIKKIFITHLHGDHLFGLPGLLCTIGQGGPVDAVIEIYGPKGIRDYVRRSLQLSYSMLGYKYVVHELLFEDPVAATENPFSGDCCDSAVESAMITSYSDTGSMSNPCDRHPDEIIGSEIALTSSSDDTDVVIISEGESCRVFAAPLSHRVPCVGYVVKEEDLPGKLDIVKLKAKGVNPGPICAQLKRGETVTLENGELLDPSDVVGPSRRGRTVVILGDTCDSRLMIPHAIGADVLVHEATYENAMDVKARLHGHSTAGMAGEFAEAIQATTLILTHFSQRYRSANRASGSTEGPGTTDSVTTDLLVTQAKERFGGEVIAAYDFYNYVVNLPL